MDGRKGVHSQPGARAHKKHYRTDEEPLAVPVWGGATRQYQPTIAGLMPAIPFIIFSFFFNSASEDPRQISELVQQDLAIVIDLLRQKNKKLLSECE